MELLKPQDKIKENDEIIKCNQCNHVLVSGKGMIAIFGKGTSIGCKKCGNKHEF